MQQIRAEGEARDSIPIQPKASGNETVRSQRGK
jgi:hypothetical protein